MVMCWAYGCNHYNVRETCKFFRIPKDKNLRTKWLKALRRSEEPGKGAFVCSCHFEQGNKDNLPTIFTFNEDKRFGTHYLSPERKTRERKLSEEYNLPSTSAETERAENLVEEVSGALDEPTQTEEQSGLNVLVHPGILSPTALEAENLLLQINLEKVQTASHSSLRFSYAQIAHDDKLFVLYTGLPQKKIFDALYNLLKDIDINYMYKSEVEKVSKIDQLLMTLMKLRQNFPRADLALRFKVSEATVSNIVITWIHVLHEILYEQLSSTVPSRNKNKSCLPNSFSTFTNCRIILDCTEIFVAVSRKSLSTQKVTYSPYKHRNTLKGLVGTAPNGVITFLSHLYPGSTSDKNIVKDCGILENLVPGDMVLADKGFLIRDILPPGVSLNIPPFLVDTQFTKAQIQQTQTIAKARIHVERAIRRMKCYKILSLIPYSLSKYADIIFKVVGTLTNLQYPLLKEVENFYT